MKVETIFTFRDYEFSYKFGVDGEELQPYKTFEGIIEASEGVTIEHNHELYMLSAGQALKVKNPDYNAEEAKAAQEVTKEGQESGYAEDEYYEVNYLEVVVKGEKEEDEDRTIRYVMEKSVNYDKFTEVTHVNDQAVSSAQQGYQFMHKTAREYKHHRTTNLKTKKLDNPNIKKAMVLDLKEKELLAMQQDGTNMSTVLVSIQFNYHYR